MTMNPTIRLLVSLLLVSFVCTLGPTPAMALRARNGGLEEKTPVTSELAQALGEKSKGSAALGIGLEETDPAGAMEDIQKLLWNVPVIVPIWFAEFPLGFPFPGITGDTFFVKPEGSATISDRPTIEYVNIDAVSDFLNQLPAGTRLSVDRDHPAVGAIKVTLTFLPIVRGSPDQPTISDLNSLVRAVDAKTSAERVTITEVLDHILSTEHARGEMMPYQTRPILTLLGVGTSDEIDPADANVVLTFADVVVQAKDRGKDARQHAPEPVTVEEIWTAYKSQTGDRKWTFRAPEPVTRAFLTRALAFTGLSQSATGLEEPPEAAFRRYTDALAGFYKAEGARLQFIENFHGVNYLDDQKYARIARERSEKERTVAATRTALARALVNAGFRSEKKAIGEFNRIWRASPPVRIESWEIPSVGKAIRTALKQQSGLEEATPPAGAGKDEAARRLAAVAHDDAKAQENLAVARASDQPRPLAVAHDEATLRALGDALSKRLHSSDLPPWSAGLEERAGLRSTQMPVGDEWIPLTILSEDRTNPFPEPADGSRENTSQEAFLTDSLVIYAATETIEAHVVGLVQTSDVPADGVKVELLLKETSLSARPIVIKGEGTTVPNEAQLREAGAAVIELKREMTLAQIIQQALAQWTNRAIGEVTKTEQLTDKRLVIYV